MKILIDTREKPHAITTIVKTFEELGIEYERKKLATADYYTPSNPNVLVDRKQSLSEVVNNLGNKKSRFYRECERAIKTHQKLVVLVEHGNGINDLKDVAKWTNPNYGKNVLCMSGKELMKRMYEVKIMYGVEWQFCDKKDTGYKILEILKRGIKK